MLRSFRVRHRSAGSLNCTGMGESVNSPAAVARFLRFAGASDSPSADGSDGTAGRSVAVVRTSRSAYSRFVRWRLFTASHAIDGASGSGNSMLSDMGTPLVADGQSDRYSTESTCSLPCMQNSRRSRQHACRRQSLTPENHDSMTASSSGQTPQQQSSTTNSSQIGRIRRRHALCPDSFFLLTGRLVNKKD